MDRPEILPEAVEQLMRMTSDEALVARLLATSPVIALGRLPRRVYDELVPGCPLLSIIGGPPLAESWRVQYPPLEGSLYDQLEFLREISPAPLNPATAYHELCARRASCEVG